MGRKIPAKKHRGVKDPLAQQAKRWQSLKGKINAPPLDPDSQPVPKSLLRLFAPRRPCGPDRPRGPRSGAPPRLPTESSRSYSHRLTAATRALIAADDSHEYPVEVDAEEASETRRRRPRTGPERPDKRQRQKEKSRAKREQAMMHKEQERVSQPCYEHLPFGETAHAPPNLTTPRRANITHMVDRPGRRDLLLSGMLRGEAAAREAARLQAVNAYRDLKRSNRRAAK